MLSLLTPENIDKVLIALAAMVTAVGGLTLRKVMREPPKPGTPDAVAVAMVDLTKAMHDMVEAMQGQNAHFADNNEMFKALGPTLGGMAKDFADTRHETAESRILLALIRDALNRRR